MDPRLWTWDMWTHVGNMWPYFRVHFHFWHQIKLLSVQFSETSYSKDFHSHLRISAVRTLHLVELGFLVFRVDFFNLIHCRQMLHTCLFIIHKGPWYNRRFAGRTDTKVASPRVLLKHYRYNTIFQLSSSKDLIDQSFS